MRLSVLLPYRDAARTLVEAMESVLAEPCVDELVCIDDGSVDEGPALVEARRRADVRVVTLSSGGRGVAAALALGASVARGALVGRMDGDDVSLPGRFAKSIARLERDGALACVGTQVEPFGDVQDGMRRYVAWQNELVDPAAIAREIFVESPLCHPSVTLRREALAAVGGFRPCPWPEDYDLFLRLDAAGLLMGKLDEPLLRWRMHGARTTRTDARCSLDRLAEARAFYLRGRLARHAPRTLALWGAGKTGRRLARALAALGVSAELVVDIDPKKQGRTLRGRPVVAPEALAVERHFVVVAVGARGAREVLRPRLDALGFREGESYLFAA